MTRARARRAAVRACILATAAVGLGLTSVPSAGASCAGPQLELQQRGSSVAPRRVGEGDDEELLFDVARDQPLLVIASNLTFDCNDTDAGSLGGCGGPARQPAQPIQPIQNAELRLSQGNRNWTLGRLEVSYDLRSRQEVTLPAAVRPGSARLVINDPAYGDTAELSLVLA